MLFRWALLLTALLGTETDSHPISDLRLIDDLNECILVRFQTLQPSQTLLDLAVEGFDGKLLTRPLPPVLAAPGPALGMSRMATPPSFGEHYVPNTGSITDFRPENTPEVKAVQALERVPLQVGTYLFGRAILDADVKTPSFRALKGPAAVTRGTPRPVWYPTAVNPAASPDALPDWKTIYPLAERAMRSFADGGKGFETTAGSWRIAARPIMASQERCVACHNMPGLSTKVPVNLGSALGGVLYAFRRGQ